MAENVRFLGDEFQIELGAVKLLIEGTVLQELKKGETQRVVFVLSSCFSEQRNVPQT